MLGAEMQTKLAADLLAAHQQDTPVPAGMPTDATMFGIDWEFVADNRDDWVKRWDREMAM